MFCLVTSSERAGSHDVHRLDIMGQGFVGGSSQCDFSVSMSIKGVKIGYNRGNLNSGP